MQKRSINSEKRFIKATIVLLFLSILTLTVLLVPMAKAQSQTVTASTLQGGASQGPPGTQLEVVITGFTAPTSVTITLGSKTLGTIGTSYIYNQDSAPFTIPPMTPGSYSVTATGGGGQVASTTFEVTSASATAAPTSAATGTSGGSSNNNSGGGGYYPTVPPVTTTNGGGGISLIVIAVIVIAIAPRRLHGSYVHKTGRRQRKTIIQRRITLRTQTVYTIRNVTPTLIALPTLSIKRYFNVSQIVILSSKSQPTPNLRFSKNVKTTNNIHIHKNISTLIPNPR